MEYCDQDLYQLYKAQPNGRFPMHKVQKYMHQITSGLAYMHLNGIAHRDISLENILIQRDTDSCKLCDFGLSTLTCQMRSEIAGKAYYMAPEVRVGIYYNPELADIWSLGILFFILLTGVPPMEEASIKDACFRYITKYGLSKLIQKWQIQIDPLAMDLISKMLCVDPLQRISVSEISIHLFFTQEYPQAKPVSKILFSQFKEWLVTSKQFSQLQKYIP